MNRGAISAIIPSRGLTALLRICVERLVKALSVLPPAAHQILIVDNATERPYQIVDLTPLEVGLIRFDTHHSYAACCNAAAERSRAEHLLLLNNDVLLHPLALAEMREAMQDERVAACGARMVFPDDTIQHCGVVFGPGNQGPFHDHRRVPTRRVPRQMRALQAVTGACMLIREDRFRALGGLDESYSFGLEDIDFCLRARQRGWSVVCVQGYDSLHFESTTEGRVALDVSSRRLFMERWKGRYGIDTPLELTQ
jgi:GT2 family glycosyltransferase